MGCILESDNMVSGAYQITMKERYLEYINEHKQNVINAFRDLFLNRIDEICNAYSNPEALRDAIELVNVEIENHDESKYGDEEFEPYRLKFYPTPEEKRTIDPDLINEKFEAAWVHHYTNNSHHTRYWFDSNGKPTDMDLSAIVHMISDWEGMSRKFGGKTTDWYRNEATKEKSEMTENTKKIVEELLDILW